MALRGAFFGNGGRRSKHSPAAGCGAVAGVGGGSALDLAKCVAALINNEGGVEQYLEITDAPKKLEGKLFHL